jgi:hypothetical protein
MPKRHWLDLVEYVFIAGSFAGTVAAVTTKQGIFAVTPLTLAIGLNVINRQRFNQLSQESQKKSQQQIEELKAELTHSNRLIPWLNNLVK